MGSETRKPIGTASLGGGRSRPRPRDDRRHGARKPGQPEREATLELRTTVVQVARPGHRRADTPAAPPLTVILAREIDPPDGLAPIEWSLLTTLSVATADDAARIVRWYS